MCHEGGDWPMWTHNPPITIGCSHMNVHMKITGWWVMDQTKTNTLKRLKSWRTVLSMFHLLDSWYEPLSNEFYVVINRQTHRPNPIHHTWPVSNDVITYSVVTPTELSVCTSKFILQMGHVFTQQSSEVQQTRKCDCDTMHGVCEI